MSTQPDKLEATARELLKNNRRFRGDNPPYDAACDTIAALLAERAALQARFTKADKPKHEGDPMLDSVLEKRNPEFDAWVASLPPTYWARYDLSAARIGWEAATSVLQARCEAAERDARELRGAAQASALNFQERCVDDGRATPEELATWRKQFKFEPEPSPIPSAQQDTKP